MRATIAAILAGVLATAAAAGQSGFVFVEPEAGAGGELPLYRPVTDPARLATLARWTENDAGRWALDVYRRARAIAERRAPGVQPQGYVVALEPGGESASVGFRLRTGGGVESHPRAAYVRLGEEEWRFVTELLHETGHVALAMLAGGRLVPRREIAPIPHTVAALTDRGTAFDEGFAIHLETLVAHVSSAPEVRRTYRHDRFLFGPAEGIRGEYFLHSGDPSGFAQPRARYAAVRDNEFAFVSAFRGPDYVRAQVERSRDFAELRDADQLLQSEGFYATFFFSVLVRGEAPATADALRQRQDRVLATLAQMFATRPATAETPFLLEFLATYGRVFPDDAGELRDVFLDLTHGVFVAPEAQPLWREHYLAAVRLDERGLARDRIAAAREAWAAALAREPALLLSRLGPQLRCEVVGRTVRLGGEGREAPLALDVNTAEEGVMRLVPGIGDAEAASWLAARERAPFADAADFRKRAGLPEKALAALRF